MAVKSKPLSAAIRRAKGEAKMRVPLAATGAAGAEACTAGASITSAATAAGADGATVASAASPSSSKIAIAEFTFTLAVPSETKSLPMMPSSTASNSIVALSVSISANRSPDWTTSPSDTSHLARVPSSIVGDRAGIRISSAMGRSLTIED